MSMTNVTVGLITPETRMSAIFRAMARKWRESAVVWRNLAREAAASKDTHTYLFASNNASERESWAEFDENNARRWEQLEGARS